MTSVPRRGRPQGLGIAKVSRADSRPGICGLTQLLREGVLRGSGELWSRQGRSKRQGSQIRQDELGVNLIAGGDTKLWPYCDRHRMTGSCFRGFSALARSLGPLPNGQ